MSADLLVTKNLRELLTRGATVDEVEVAVDMVKHYSGQFAIAARDANPESLAFTVHHLVDESVAIGLRSNPRGREVTCSRGCNACCHLHVEIDPNEAALLVHHAREVGLEVDVERLRRQSGRTLETWRELSATDRRCVFNDPVTRECQVYEHRPTSCRKYHVVSDPALCDTVAHPGQEVGELALAVVEIVISAQVSTFGGGLMADLLLAALAVEVAP